MIHLREATSHPYPYRTKVPVATAGSARRTHRRPKWRHRSSNLRTNPCPCKEYQLQVRQMQIYTYIDIYIYISRHIHAHTSIPYSPSMLAVVWYDAGHTSTQTVRADLYTQSPNQWYINRTKLTKASQFTQIALICITCYHDKITETASESDGSSSAVGCSIQITNCIVKTM